MENVGKREGTGRKPKAKEQGRAKRWVLRITDLYRVFVVSGVKFVDHRAQRPINK